MDFTGLHMSAKGLAWAWTQQIPHMSSSIPDLQCDNSCSFCVLAMLTALELADKS